MNLSTISNLRAALDAARGHDPWNNGPRLTIRALLLARETSDGPSRWERLQNANRASLEIDAHAAWQCNQLDRFAPLQWEIMRRKLGVDVSTVDAWLTARNAEAV